MNEEARVYDAVVLGLGGMGSATLAHLAERGQRVLGIERFGRAHDRGSSTGQSRIIRMAYYEDPAYVPLLRRAYELWERLERDSGRALLNLCGVLMIGGADSRILAGAAASAGAHGIVVDALTLDDVTRRFPALRLRSSERALFEPRAGMVFPEAAIEAHLDLAERAGARTRFTTTVRGFTPQSDAIAIDLDDGTTIRTQRLAICAGPWLAQTLRELHLPLRVQRNVQVWFEPADAGYDLGAFPAFFVDRDDAPAALYGFPDYGIGLKAALHGYGPTTTPDALDRTVRDADVAPVKALLDDVMPGAAHRFLGGKTCMYTLTPDEHFLIDRHPADDRIVIAGGFSGHGYKFCSVVGEICADLVTEGRTRHPIEFLRLARLTGPATHNV